jgi:hypothetical protein
MLKGWPQQNTAVSAIPTSGTPLKMRAT